MVKSYPIRFAGLLTDPFADQRASPAPEWRTMGKKKEPKEKKAGRLREGGRGMFVFFFFSPGRSREPGCSLFFFWKKSGKRLLFKGRKCVETGFPFMGFPSNFWISQEKGHWGSTAIRVARQRQEPWQENYFLKRPDTFGTLQMTVIHKVQGRRDVRAHSPRSQENSQEPHLKGRSGT